jgi:signal transduction histidine kinase
MITVVAPIYKDEKFLGVASLDIKIKEHGEKMFGTFKFPDRYLMMIDREGTIMVKSTLLSNYSSANQLYNKDRNKFVQEFEGIKSIFKKSILPGDYNRTIAKALSKGSPEIEAQESKRIAEIIQKREESLRKGITKDIKFIQNDPILQKESIIATFHFPVTHWKVIIGIPKEQVLNASNAMYQKIIDAMIYLTLLSTLIGYFILKRVFINPIEEINKQLQNNNISSENHYKLLEYNDKGEIGALVDNLNLRTMDLVVSKERESEEIQKRIVNEKLLVQQAKMAEVGGMMDSVAHQWKQPLNALSMYSEIIKRDFKDGEVDEAYIDQFHDDIQLQIDHMLTTLDEFRTFFRPNKEEEAFQLLDVINSVLLLTKDEFMKHSITINIIKKTPIEIYGHKNEFKHLILNIINNAKDAFNENKIEKRVISFSLIEDKEGEKLEIRDNAGGIPDSVIGDIFKANITTKTEGKGTGIGLFMSMQIAKKNGADLSVHNEGDGACFVVKFNPNQVIEL